MLRVLVALVVIVALWAAIIRPWLRKQAWAQRFFDIIEPIERNLWLKSESILWARTLMFVGTALTALANFDPTVLDTLMPFATLLPESWQPYAQGIIKVLPMVITLAGIMNERLRRDTTKPLAVVALSPDAPPAAVAAAEHADAAAQQATKVINATT